MNFHRRSYSEQPQMAQATVTPNVATNGNGHQSFIRVHSDSQQSLDQLFNPTQPTVPLRSRNLPLSFFNPSVKCDILESSANGQLQNSGRTPSLHHRSISFGHQNQSVANPNSQHQRPNFHMRTHSTLAPMPRLLSNDSSYQSSHEFINQPMTPGHEQTFSSSSTNIHQQGMHNRSHSNSGWSSAANSTDNLSSSGWMASQPSLSHNQSNQAMVLAQPQQPMQVVHDASSPMAQQPIMSTGHSLQNNVYNTNTSAQLIVSESILEQHHHHHHHACANNLHARSTSFNPQVGAQPATQHSFHAGTHSSITPMSSSTLVPTNQHAVSNHSLHQSSQELGYPSNKINSSSTNGWSSSGYSTDDMNVGGSQGWLPIQNQQQTSTEVIKPMQTDLHDYYHHQQNHHHNHPHEHYSHNHHHHMRTQPQHQQTNHAQLFHQVEAIHTPQ